MSLLTRRGIGHSVGGNSLLGWSTEHTITAMKITAMFAEMSGNISPHNLHLKTDAMHSAPAAKGFGLYFRKTSIECMKSMEATQIPLWEKIKLQQNKLVSGRFEAFTVVMIKIHAFMNVIPCQWLSIFQRFGGSGASGVVQEEYYLWQESRPVVFNVGHTTFLRTIETALPE